MEASSSNLKTNEFLVILEAFYFQYQKKRCCGNNVIGLHLISSKHSFGNNGGALIHISKQT